ncbi:MAG: 2-octaprenyl-6-methoxyphenyl hydroxylase [Steroidobacteraceae bacterium]
MSAALPGEFDVLIVGGGMVGASLALALGQSGRSVALLEAIAADSALQPSFDERTTALGNGSRQIFTALGVWPQIEREAAAIEQIHVSDAGRFGFARLDASELDLAAFGYVVPNRVIGTVLWARLAAMENVSLLVPARVENVEYETRFARVSARLREGQHLLQAPLLIAADGAHSVVRQAAGIDVEVEDYEQVALVANVETDSAARGIAYERFTPQGPIALLPRSDRQFTAVWTRPASDAATALALDDATFLAQLQDAFGWRAGRMQRLARCGSYPLQLSRASGLVGRRTLVIGNAAQALHPVAGQGFNLGLRDVAFVCEWLQEAVGDPGSEAQLARYANARNADREAVTRFTDTLIRTFGDRRPWLAAARDLGLLLFDLAPPVKRALAGISYGMAGSSPRLARGARP